MDPTPHKPSFLTMKIQVFINLECWLLLFEFPVRNEKKINKIFSIKNFERGYPENIFL